MNSSYSMSSPRLSFISSATGGSTLSEDGSLVLPLIFPLIFRMLEMASLNMSDPFDRLSSTS